MGRPRPRRRRPRAKRRQRRRPTGKGRQAGAQVRRQDAIPAGGEGCRQAGQTRGQTGGEEAGRSGARGDPSGPRQAPLRSSRAAPTTDRGSARLREHLSAALVRPRRAPEGDLLVSHRARPASGPAGARRRRHAYARRAVSGHRLRLALPARHGVDDARRSRGGGAGAEAEAAPRRRRRRAGIDGRRIRRSGRQLAVFGAGCALGRRGVRGRSERPRRPTASTSSANCWAAASPPACVRGTPSWLTCSRPRRRRPK